MQEGPVIMREWLNGRTDRGGVLWGIVCCWSMVAANFALLHFRAPIFYVVPFDVIGVPVMVTLALRVLDHSRGPR
jgi:hypothetical protein